MSSGASIFSQMAQSRYNLDNQGNYGYFKRDKKANQGRLISAIDIPAKIACGFVSSTASAVMIPGRAVAGAAGVLIGIPVTAAIESKFFTKQSTYEHTAGMFELSAANLFSFTHTVPHLFIDAGARVVSIGADILGMVLPQIGQKARLFEKETSDAIDDARTNIMFKKPLLSSNLGKILDRVWPRADRAAWRVMFSD